MNRLFIISCFIFVFADCIAADCINEVREELISPDGKHKIILFSRNCGATTGLNTQATVLKKEEKLPDEPGNIFIVDKGEAKAFWKKDGGIRVILDPSARIFKKEPLVHGIPIEYKEITEANQRLQTMRFNLPMNSIAQGPHV